MTWDCSVALWRWSQILWQSLSTSVGKEFLSPIMQMNPYPRFNDPTKFELANEEVIPLIRNLVVNTIKQASAEEVEKIRWFAR